MADRAPVKGVRADLAPLYPVGPAGGLTLRLLQAGNIAGELLMLGAFKVLPALTFLPPGGEGSLNGLDAAGLEGNDMVHTAV